MSKLLQNMKSTGSIAEKIVDYNEANRKVAILCNHKRTVAAGHESQMEKLGDRIKGLKYQKWRVKQMMLNIDPKIKKKKEKEEGHEYFQLDEELEEIWIHEHQNYLVDEERQKIEKKFNKENEKLKADGGKEMKHKELEDRLEDADQLAKKFKKENKTGKVEAEGKGPTVEKCEGNLAKLDQRINTMLFQAKDKENNKEVALGTSKIVSAFMVMFRVLLTNAGRITSIRVLPWSSPRNLTCPLKNSSPRHCGRNSIGRSSRWRKIGNSEKPICESQRFQTKKFEGLSIARAAIWHGMAWIT